MTIHTVIPDIHADIDRLEDSLSCVSRDGKVLFLGDFIDAGEGVAAGGDAEVLHQVKALVESDRALAVMGNHELNAILFHKVDANGCPLRKHCTKNVEQHRSFLDDFGYRSEQALEWTDWFLAELPLWRELDGLRLVHACWSQKHVNEIKKRRPKGYLSHDDLAEVAAENTSFGRSVKALVTGPEVTLPEPYKFRDYHGNERNEVRLAWWNAGAKTWPEATLSVPNPSDLPRGTLPDYAATEIYSQHAPPVLVGHYKMNGEPTIEHPKAASLDYPDIPCVYHWSGGDQLSQDNLQTV